MRCIHYTAEILYNNLYWYSAKVQKRKKKKAHSFSYHPQYFLTKAKSLGKWIGGRRDSGDKSNFSTFPYLNPGKSNNLKFLECFPCSKSEVIISYHLAHSKYSTNVCTIKFPRNSLWTSVSHWTTAIKLGCSRVNYGGKSPNEVSCLWWRVRELIFFLTILPGCPCFAAGSNFLTWKRFTWWFSRSPLRYLSRQQPRYLKSRKSSH